MKDKLVILTGPTAIGKTKLSVDLAKNLNAEIISCDSMQIYKHMDIGTAKVTEEEMDGVVHHLVDFVEVDQEYTVSDFQKDADRLIKDINNRGKVAIVTGGTGLYINSLVYKLNFAQIPPNDEIRQKYEDLLLSDLEEGKKIIYDKLCKIDPDSASKIHINDTKRVIRALEVYDITGKTMSEYGKNFRSENDDYNLAMVVLNMNREKLYERINLRVDLMMENGLVEEVKSILEKGYSRDLISLQGIGYKEIIEYLNEEISLEEAVEQIKQGSRNYAKRQLTWFRRDERFKWFNKDKFENEDEILLSVTDYIINKLEGEINGK